MQYFAVRSFLQRDDRANSSTNIRCVRIFPTKRTPLIFHGMSFQKSQVTDSPIVINHSILCTAAAAAARKASGGVGYSPVSFSRTIARRLSTVIVTL